MLTTSIMHPAGCSVCRPWPTCSAHISTYSERAHTRSHYARTLLFPSSHIPAPHTSNEIIALYILGKLLSALEKSWFQMSVTLCVTHTRARHLSICAVTCFRWIHDVKKWRKLSLGDFAIKRTTSQQSIKQKEQSCRAKMGKCAVGMCARWHRAFMAFWLNSVWPGGVRAASALVITRNLISFKIALRYRSTAKLDDVAN